MNDSQPRVQIGWYRMENGLPAFVNNRDGVANAGSFLFIEPEADPPHKQIGWRMAVWTSDGKHSENKGFNLETCWKGSLLVDVGRYVDFPKDAPRKPDPYDFSFQYRMPDGCGRIWGDERLREGDLVLTTLGTWVTVPPLLEGLPRKELRQYNYLTACRPRSPVPASPEVDLSTACPGYWKTRDGRLARVEIHSPVPGVANPYFGRVWLPGADSWSTSPHAWSKDGKGDAYDIVAPWSEPLPALAVLPAAADAVGDNLPPTPPEGALLGRIEIEGGFVDVMSGGLPDPLGPSGVVRTSGQLQVVERKTWTEPVPTPPEKEEYPDERSRRAVPLPLDRKEAAVPPYVFPPQPLEEKHNPSPALVDVEPSLLPDDYLAAMKGKPVYRPVTSDGVAAGARSIGELVGRATLPNGRPAIAINPRQGEPLRIVPADDAAVAKLFIVQGDDRMLLSLMETRLTPHPAYVEPDSVKPPPPPPEAQPNVPFSRPVGSEPGVLGDGVDRRCGVR